MRRLITAVATMAVFVVPLAMPTGALANAAPANQTPGSGFGDVGWTGTSQGGQNQTTTQYSASYPLFGDPVTCRGVHQTGKNFPGFGQDSFTCTSTTGGPLAGFSPGQVIAIPPGGWISDYFAVLNGSGVLNTQTLNLTVSPDGMSFIGVAVYF